MTRQPIILFDLGGVLVDLGDPVGSLGLNISGREFWNIWLRSPVVHKYETGLISTGDFLARFAVELDYPGRGNFEQAMRSWELPLYAGAETFLATLMRHCEVALLSNTNEIHWQHVQSQTRVFAGFSRLFLSFESGNRKPDSQAYEQVVSHFGCDPADIIFLDDSADNIVSARDAGLRAHQVNGLAQAQQVIADLM